MGAESSPREVQAELVVVDSAALPGAAASTRPTALGAKVAAVTSEEQEGVTATEACSHLSAQAATEAAEMQGKPEVPPVGVVRSPGPELEVGAKVAGKGGQAAKKRPRAAGPW